MQKLDVVALALPKALECFAAAGVICNIVRTQPSGTRLPRLAETELYVIRQTVDGNGVQQLVAAAKMAKHGQDLPASPN